jgi:DNA-binding GntR family transcriptional regulator
VRIPSPDDVRGHYVVRESLETQAARLFSEKASKAERVSLQEIGARVDRLSQESDRKRYLRLHYEFHRGIAEGARCPVLSAAIEQTCALSSTWFCVFPRPVGVGVPRRHRDLAKALATGTSAVAAAAMRKHVRWSRQEALHRLQPYFAIRRSTGRTFSRRPQRVVS